MSAQAARRVPGEPGIWLVVIADIAVFLILFGTYLHYLDDQPAVFAAAQDELTPAFGFVNTLLLLTSSLAVVGQRFGAAMALGGLFVVSKAIEWTAKADDGHVPDENDFFALYYVLTGLHLLHVLVGLVCLWLARRIAARATPRPQDAALVQSAGLFWHMVDLLWLVLFALVYFVH